MPELPNYNNNGFVFFENDLRFSRFCINLRKGFVNGNLQVRFIPVFSAFNGLFSGFTKIFFPDLQIFIILYRKHES